MQGVDHQLGTGGEPVQGLAEVRGAQQVRGEVGGAGRGEARGDGGQVDRGAGGAGDVAVGAVGGEVQHEVAAQHGESAVGAVVADMAAAVRVDDDVADLRPLGGGEAEGVGLLGQDGGGGVDRGGAGGAVGRAERWWG